MNKRFALIVLGLVLFAALLHATPHKFTLVIDAGHGGHDSGAVGAFSKEKDINLRTALTFGRYVETNCPDVNVIYTRKTDVFVTLQGRAEIANKAKADLFISIHTNSVSGSKTVRGFETYTLGMHRAADNLDVAKRENSVILVEKDYKERYEGFDPNSAESYIIFEFMQHHNMSRSVEFAKMVQDHAPRMANRVNKGVKQAGFLVLRETSMPSCLIELGFISTPDEEQFLNTEAGIDNIARGIYQAFAKYKNKHTGSKEPLLSEEPKPQQVPEVKPAAEEAKSVAETKPKVVEETKPKAVADKPKVEEVKPKAVAEVKPKVEESKAKAVAETRKEEPKVAVSGPVFKVQICASDRVLTEKDPRLKGHTEAKSYKENGMVKYTIGETTDYNEILRLRKQLAEEFEGAFVVAFKGEEKINLNDAIKEYKENKK